MFYIASGTQTDYIEIHKTVLPCFVFNTGLFPILLLKTKKLPAWAGRR